MDINKIANSIKSNNNANCRYVCINGKNIMLNQNGLRKSLKEFIEDFE